MTDTPIDPATDPATGLADDYHEHRLKTRPTWAQMIGDYRYVDRFEDVSRGAEDAVLAQLREFADRAAAIPDDALDVQQRITRDMVARDATATAAMLESRTEEFAANPIFGQQASLQVVVPMLNLPDAAAAEGMVGKYAGVATYFRDSAERHRQGVAAGRTPAEFAVRQTVEQLDSWLATDVGEDPLLRTQQPPEGVDRDAWRQRLVEVIEQQVRPAVAFYRDVLRDEVLPHVRPDEKCGLTWLPGGDEVYARALRYFTTTELTAQEIHEIGLQQIASLEKEYAALGPEVVGTDDVAAIFEALRSDPALHHTSGEEIVEDSKTAMARAKAAMPAWFEVLPQSDCGVEPTVNGAKAFYFPPASDGSRGGTFFMNVTEPESWGRFEIEAVSYHEGIPGHHLQLAIAAELESVPEFRKRAFIAAYGEGWGLYTERLADEMGLYSTPTDRIGMLSADSMRACRLVVDTGMHALGWSRQQAVDYMVANSPLTTAAVVAEIDRYAVTPGQACSYMIGRLEIQRMRREAEERLGDGFSVKAFHSAVLDSGPLPLGLLDQVVRARLT
ncbi:MAG: DUF885 domain-containing protein [Nocardioidaceae bacterium]